MRTSHLTEIEKGEYRSLYTTMATERTKAARNYVLVGALGSLSVVVAVGGISHEGIFAEYPTFNSILNSAMFGILAAERNLKARNAIDNTVVAERKIVEFEHNHPL